MSQAIAMDQAGRIVLPKEVRQRLNLAPGARLMLDVVAQRIELTPEPQALVLLGAGLAGLAAFGRRRAA